MANTTADRLARFASGFLAGIEQGLSSAGEGASGDGTDEKGSD